MLRRQVDRPRQGARPGGRVLVGQAEDEIEVDVGEAGRRAAWKAVSASSALWMRPSQASSASSKLCTPMLSRLTPMPANAAKCAWSTVPGLASLVISASAATSNASRHASSTSARSVGGSTVGVPPPMKIVRTAGRPRSSPARRISRISAAA